MNSKDRVDILLATWNGEKFLEKQLNSILAQSYMNWRLLVSDDGSTDNSMSILMKYELRDARITIVNNLRKGGVVENFGELVRFSSSPYIMFCDQDDVWMNDKVCTMIHAIKYEEDMSDVSMPLLGFSDMSLVDEAGSVIKDSFYRSNKLDPNNNLDIRYLMWRSSVYGCTTIFNKSLLSMAAPMPMNVAMHDHWFALVAARFGKIFFVEKSTIYYRQHSRNVVGGRPKSFLERLRSAHISFSKIRSWANEVRSVLDDYYLNGDKLYLDAKGRLSFLEKIYFIKKCVFPYLSERFSFTLIFLIFFLGGRG